ncbi:MAG: ABC-ATPase domain-containing protein [Gammaproteobacteria bacterium]|nr:ABC-ATPase domain-containing protein [Gammaproteobacteria bacterium]MDH5801673.1 ABC-ATPase domain-containing protein [Gammaproteobacteria bacterium]
MEKLRQRLHQLDGKSYKAFKDIQGQYEYDRFSLSIDHVQGDPFAAPSRVSVQVPMEIAAFPKNLWNNPIRKTALEDFLGRRFSSIIRKVVKGHRGSGGSGEVNVSTSGQQILQRNAVLVTESWVEARITMGLPANGRRAAGQQAIAMFMDELPQLVHQALVYAQLPSQQALTHINCAEDQEFLRHWLEQQQLVAFVADGAILPRRSGVDDSPLKKAALAFQAPPSLSVTAQLPNGGTLSGMGIPKGISLIVGGGFHGKSTLLHALERGVYNHIPGDGREQVVCDAAAVKVRAEDGRAVSLVNISPFIDRLPFDRDTHRFSTENASGSTSQAANIIEAFQCGTRVLLIDEDTSATNFMIRDDRMQALVAQDKEPITPLLYRVRELYDQHGVSSVIVMGGSGDYFDVADTVIMMDTYAPKDVTQAAKSLARPPRSSDSTLPPFQRISQRRPGKAVLDPSRRNRDVKIDARGLSNINYGEHNIDLSLVEQLIDQGQTRCIGLLIHYYARHYAQTGDLIQGLQQCMEDVQSKGLDTVSPYKVGNLALPRLHEVAAAINRIREGNWHSS